MSAPPDLVRRRPPPTAQRRARDSGGPPPRGGFGCPCPEHAHEHDHGEHDRHEANTSALAQVKNGARHDSLTLTWRIAPSPGQATRARQRRPLRRGRRLAEQRAPLRRYWTRTPLGGTGPNSPGRATAQTPDKHDDANDTMHACAGARARRTRKAFCRAAPRGIRVHQACVDHFRRQGSSARAPQPLTRPAKSITHESRRQRRDAPGTRVQGVEKSRVGTRASTPLRRRANRHPSHCP